MPDYKEMYLEMVRETEKAINILIAVQQKCEEQYIEAVEPEIVMLNGDCVPNTETKGDSPRKQKLPGFK